MSIESIVLDTGTVFYLGLLAVVLGTAYLTLIHRRRGQNWTRAILLALVHGCALLAVVLALAKAQLTWKESVFKKPHIPVVLDLSASYTRLIDRDSLIIWWKNWVKFCDEQGFVTSIWNMTSGEELSSSFTELRNLLYSTSQDRSLSQSNWLFERMTSFKSGQNAGESPHSATLKAWRQVEADVKGVVWLTDGRFSDLPRTIRLTVPQFPYSGLYIKQMDLAPLDLVYTYRNEDSEYSDKLDGNERSSAALRTALQLSIQSISNRFENLNEGDSLNLDTLLFQYNHPNIQVSCRGDTLIHKEYWRQDSGTVAVLDEDLWSKRHKDFSNFSSTQITLELNPTQLKNAARCDSLWVSLDPGPLDSYSDNNSWVFSTGKPSLVHDWVWTGQGTNPDAHFFLRALSQEEPQLQWENTQLHQQSSFSRPKSMREPKSDSICPDNRIIWGYTSDLFSQPCQKVFLGLYTTLSAEKDRFNEFQQQNTAHQGEGETPLVKVMGGGKWKGMGKENVIPDTSLLTRCFRYAQLPPLKWVQADSLVCYIGYGKGKESACLLAGAQTKTQNFLRLYGEGFWKNGMNSKEPTAFISDLQELIRLIVVYFDTDSLVHEDLGINLASAEVMNLGNDSLSLLELARSSGGKVWGPRIEDFPLKSMPEVEVFVSRESLWLRPSSLMLIAILFLCIYWILRYSYSWED